MSQLKDQGKNPRKATKLSGDGKISIKRIQNKDSENDQDSWKQNGEDVRNVYQRPRRTKNRANRDEQYTKRNKLQNN